MAPPSEGDQRLREMAMAMTKMGDEHEGEEARWRVGFWECFGDMGLCCEAVWCPCLVGGRTHQRVNGVEERRLRSLSGYVCVPNFHGSSLRL